MKKWKIKQHLMLHNYVQLLAFQLIFFYFFILWIIEMLYIFLQQKCKRWFRICTKVQITIKKEINGEWFQKQKFLSGLFVYSMVSLSDVLRFKQYAAIDVICYTYIDRRIFEVKTHLYLLIVSTYNLS